MGAIPTGRELGEAILLERLTGDTLVIAKLDRLSCNTAFLLTLRDTGVKFHACALNYFNQECCHSSRYLFKATRAAALAEWRGLCLA